ncbi:hypothetical protein DL546_007880 [Coniochaeta pulveracea]|uniref:Uncharacterized protein n=1 Tax=Coniochaeta pulveracea TaxID=177199 RepID=A0A420YJ77_9PEZI|nr:hypothetical protein DL546_007880 [Coniochaeta pulveracea]
MPPPAPNPPPSFYNLAELRVKKEEMKAKVLANASQHMDDEWATLLLAFHDELDDTVAAFSPSARFYSRDWLAAHPPNFGLSEQAKQAVLQAMGPVSDDIPEARAENVGYVPRMVVEARFMEIETEYMKGVDRAMAGMKVQTRERFEEWLGRMVKDAQNF